MKRFWLLLTIVIISQAICYAAGDKPIKLAKLIYFEGSVNKKKPTGHGKLILDRSMKDANANYHIEGDFNNDKITNAVFYVNDVTSSEKIYGDFVYSINEKESSIVITLNNVTIDNAEGPLNSNFENTRFRLEHINLGDLILGKEGGGSGYKWGMGSLRKYSRIIQYDIPFDFNNEYIIGKDHYDANIIKILTGSSSCTRKANIEIRMDAGRNFFRIVSIQYASNSLQFKNGSTFKMLDAKNGLCECTTSYSDLLKLRVSPKLFGNDCDLLGNSIIFLMDKSKIEITDFQIKQAITKNGSIRDEWDAHVNGAITFSDGSKYNGSILLPNISGSKGKWGISIYNYLKALKSEDIVLYKGQYTEVSGKEHTISGIQTIVGTFRDYLVQKDNLQSDTIISEEYYKGLPEKYQADVKKAVKGDPVAQTKIGNCYNNGDGVTVDYEKANYWYRRAALQGYADAQNKLGYNIDEGNGTNKNAKEAMLWYMRAAEQGFVKAQYNVAYNYSKGIGVAKDERIAAIWYQRAAELGDAPSQNCIGVYYELGLGVEQNWQKAKSWYEKAAAQGYGQAEYNLGYYYYGGHEFNGEKALYWYRKAAAQGIRDSKEKVAMIERDIRESKKPLKYRTCTNCNGTGLCSTCNGKGWFIHPMNNEHMKCGLCMYTGKCPTCRGSGKEAYR